MKKNKKEIDFPPKTEQSQISIESTEKRKEKITKVVFSMIIPLLVSIVGTYFTGKQLEASNEQNAYTNLFTPFTYSAESVPSPSDKYVINDNLELSAYDTVFQVETGACTSFHCISYNGADDDILLKGTNLKTRESPEYIFEATGRMPYDSLPELYDKIYDFFFVYTVSASGEKDLSLFYYTIDLSTETVEEVKKLNEIELLSKVRYSDPLFDDMCKRYEELSQKIDNLPTINLS